MKRILLLGSGNVAEAFARSLGAAKPAITPEEAPEAIEQPLSALPAACPAAGKPTPPAGTAPEELRLVGVWARNGERGRAVAALGGTVWSDDFASLPAADLYIMAVSDRAVGELAASLPLPDGALVAHTAGSVGIEALPARLDRAVLYPLQTFTRGRTVDLGEVPLLVECAREESYPLLESIARSLSRRVVRADSAQRTRLHLAAVFACNFANHLYALGVRLAAEAGLDPALLRPLVGETAAKALAAADPAAVQTGPAVRGDTPTLLRHEELLAGQPELLALYRSISQSIWETSRKTSRCATPSSSTSTAC